MGETSCRCEVSRANNTFDIGGQGMFRGFNQYCRGQSNRLESSYLQVLYLIRSHGVISSVKWWEDKSVLCLTLERRKDQGASNFRFRAANIQSSNFKLGWSEPPTFSLSCHGALIHLVRLQSLDVLSFISKLQFLSRIKCQFAPLHVVNYVSLLEMLTRVNELDMAYSLSVQADVHLLS